MKKIFLTLIVLISITSCEKDSEEILKLLLEIKTQNDNLKVQVSNLQKTTDSLSLALKNVNTSISSLDKKIDSIKLQLKSVLQEIDSINQQLKTANANISDLQAKLTELQKKCDELFKLLNSYINSVPPMSLKNGLIAYYPFTGNMLDSSGNNYHGVVPFGVSPRLTADRFGVPNRAYHFQDTSTIIVPNSTKLNIFPITISLWYNVDSLYKGMLGNVFSKYVSASWNGYQILLGDYSAVPNGTRIENDGYGVTSWYIKDYNNRIISYYGEPPFLQKNIISKNWYHYVFVANATEGKIYVNGILVSTDTWTGESGPSSNGFPFKIGGSYDDKWFKGKIDDIRVYNRTLSQEEIEYLYKN